MPFEDGPWSIGVGKIMIVRQGQLVDSFRDYRIFVDSNPVGKISKDSSLEIDVTSGVHFVQASIDWANSNLLRVFVRSGQTTKIEVASTMGPFASLFPALSIGSGRYLSLRFL